VSERLTPAGLVLRLATRPPTRLFARWLMTALISFITAGALILGSGTEEGAERGAARLGADLMIVSEKTEIPSLAGLYGGIPVRGSLPDGIEKSVGAMPGVTGVAPQYVFLSAADACCEVGNLPLVGFDPSRDFTVLPWLPPGAGFTGGKDRVIAGWRMMKAPGASLRFHNHTVTVVQRLERSGTASIDSALFIPLDGFAAMERSSGQSGTRFEVPWGRPSILLVKLAPNVDPRESGVELERRIPGIRVETMPGQLREKKAQLAMLGRGKVPLALSAWLFAVLACGAFQYLQIRERRASMGLLQAFGCRKMFILGISVADAYVISLAGMAAGSTGAYLSLKFAGRYLEEATGVPLLTEGIHLYLAHFPWLWTVFATAVALEAFIVVFLALRSEPADLLRGSP
jgi:putative ABC transport system permease protein